MRKAILSAWGLVPLGDELTWLVAVQAGVTIISRQLARTTDREQPGSACVRGRGGWK
jgi:hypothetical protein